MLDVVQFYEAGVAAGITHAAIWTPQGGIPVAIDVLFVNDYNEIYETEGNRPILRAPSVLLPAVAQGDAITVHGANYRVAAIHRDTPHPGETALLLSKT